MQVPLSQMNSTDVKFEGIHAIGDSTTGTLDGENFLQVSSVRAL
jgi:hypothetical protein